MKINRQGFPLKFKSIDPHSYRACSRDKVQNSSSFLYKLDLAKMGQLFSKFLIILGIVINFKVNGQKDTTATANVKDELLTVSMDYSFRSYVHPYTFVIIQMFLSKTLQLLHLSFAVFSWMIVVNWILWTDILDIISAASVENNDKENEHGHNNASNSAKVKLRKRKHQPSRQPLADLKNTDEPPNKKLPSKESSFKG